MSDVVYRFVPLGVGDVVDSFERIETAAIRHSRVVGRASQQAQQGFEKRTGVYRTSARQEEAGRSRADREAEAARRKTERDEQRSIQRRQDYERRQRSTHFANLHKAEEKAQREQSRRQERAEKARIQRTARIWSNVKSLAFDAIGGGAMAAIGAGGALVGSATRRGMADLSAANRLSVSARGAGEAYVSPEQLRREAAAVARSTPGIATSDVLAGSSAVVQKTGNLDLARKLQSTLATTSSATGSSMEELGQVAGDLALKFNLTKVEDVQDAMAALTYQGKAAQFELKDLASQLPKMGAAAQRFGLDKGAKGIRTLGGFAQLAKSSFGSAEETATGVSGTLRQLIAKSGRLRGMGVNVFDKKGNTRDLPDVLVDLVSKVGGKDIAQKRVKLQEIMGEDGIGAISPLIDTFANAVKNGGDGVAAMRTQLDQAINVAGSWSDIQTDAAKSQEDASKKLDAAWETLVDKAAQQLAPQLSGLADTFRDTDGVMDAMVGTVGVLVEALGFWLKYMNFMGQKLGFIDAPTPEKALANDRKELDVVNARIDSEARKNQREMMARGEIGPASASAEAINEREQILSRIAKSEAALKAGDKLSAANMSPDEAKSFIAQNAGDPATKEYLEKRYEAGVAQGVTTKMDAKLGDAGKMVPPELAAGARAHQQAAKALLDAAKAISDNAGSLVAPGANRGNPLGGPGIAPGQKI